MKCEKCKTNDGKFNSCEADGRMHHHGAIHTKEKGLMFLCQECANEENAKWRNK
jgi:hypothetical protein